jgi:pyruvate kinase
MGPACRDVNILSAMISSGMDVARLNFSHGDHKEHKENLRVIREASKKII